MQHFRDQIFRRNFLRRKSTHVKESCSVRVGIASLTRRIITWKHLLPASRASSNHDDGTSFSANAMTASFFSNEEHCYVTVAGGNTCEIPGLAWTKSWQTRGSQWRTDLVWFREIPDDHPNMPKNFSGNSSTERYHRDSAMSRDTNCTYFRESCNMLTKPCYPFSTKMIKYFPLYTFLRHHRSPIPVVPEL